MARLTRESVDHLVLFDREVGTVEVLRAELACTGVVGDISSATAREELVAKVCGLPGPLRWVVLTSALGFRGAVTEVTVDTLEAVMGTNVVATYGSGRGATETGRVRLKAPALSGSGRSRLAGPCRVGLSMVLPRPPLSSS